jgi:plasmid stabilization system protein ParE
LAKVAFLPQANRDLAEALTWYRERSQSTAERFAAAVDATIDKIAADPDSLAKDRRTPSAVHRPTLSVFDHLSSRR